TEILGAETQAGRLAYIGVDVLRADRPVLARLVNILEELLARQFLNRAQDLGDAPIRQLHRPPLTRLAGEAKIHLRAINLKVATAQRRQPEAVVLLRIGVVADSHQGFVEKPDNRRDDTRAGYAAPSQVLIDDGA